jgi:nucleotide-binding universal stress UspA family protein
MANSASPGNAGVDERRTTWGGSSMCDVDGSPDSQAALGVAKKLAERLEAMLVLAHVAEVPVAPYAAAGGMGACRIARQPTTLATRDDQEEAGARLLEQIAAEHGLGDAERRVVLGFPAERLADLADDEDAELIVVGSRGAGDSRRRFSAASPTAWWASPAARYSSCRPAPPRRSDLSRPET